MERTSSQIFQTNLEVLRQGFPALAERLMNDQSPCRVVVQGTPSGLPTLEVLNPSGEAVLYHSRHDPRREALRWADSPQIRDSSRLVLFGLGLGYHAMALLASAPRAYLCIFEPRMDVYRAAMECMDLRPLLTNSHVHLLCGEPTETLYRTLLAGMGEFLSTGFEFFSLPAAARACPGEFEETQREIQRVSVALQGMLRHMETTGYQTQNHVLRNIPAIYRALPPSAAKDRMAGRPALIVAAGPSLDKNIIQIPEAVGRSVIFAVDTSLRLLRKQGVEPHFVVTKDP
ncbi:MAG: 6-hydroxymethylpterin diphosphokinase MptE-like protein, partial [bacterium]